ncbi:MAG: riboflavin synthase [Thermoplasmatota archaeon]
MSLADIVAQYAAAQVPPARGRAVYGIVDTTFAVCRQGPRAVDQLNKHGVPSDRIAWRTVPGFKDLGVAARQLIDAGCDIVIACGMAGPEEIDKQCAQDASLGLQMCQQATGVPVLEVIIHMDEADGQALIDVVDNRVREHATNAFWMMEHPGELTQRSGTGQRQGFEDIGSIENGEGEAKDS